MCEHDQGCNAPEGECSGVCVAQDTNITLEDGIEAEQMKVLRLETENQRLIKLVAYLDALCAEKDAAIDRTNKQACDLGERAGYAESQLEVLGPHNGHTLTRNHNGDALLMKDGKAVGVVKEILARNVTLEAQLAALQQLADGRLEQLNADRRQYLDLRDQLAALQAGGKIVGTLHIDTDTRYGNKMTADFTPSHDLDMEDGDYPLYTKAPASEPSWEEFMQYDMNAPASVQPAIAGKQESGDA